MKYQQTCLPIVFAVSLGCAANPPPICIPEVITREVLVPVTVWNNAEHLPELHLPTYFPHPGEAATNEEKKAWAISIADTALKREALQEARIKALEIQLDATRSPP